MTALPIQIDPTIEAVLRQLERAEWSQQPRPYLGMSAIGQPCHRRLWYAFRWAARERMTATSLLRINDGHRGETAMAAMLNAVDGIELLTEDPRTGKQFGFADIGGHFRGHADGMITGLLQAPATLHVWEAKVVAEDKATKLYNLTWQIGEKNALAKWDEVYYAQAVLYMHYAKATRHYLTCGSPGVRSMVGVRTDADPLTTQRLQVKAKTIITAQEPLQKLSDDPAWWQCKGCAMSGICHRNELPAVNCRTCVHATPELDGDGRWSCAKWGADIPVEAQRVGCEQHRYIPALVTVARQVDASEQDGWIEYRTSNGVTFRNGSGTGGLSSEEIRSGAWLESRAAA